MSPALLSSGPPQLMPMPERDPAAAACLVRSRRAVSTTLPTASRQLRTPGSVRNTSRSMISSVSFRGLPRTTAVFVPPMSTPTRTSTAPPVRSPSVAPGFLPEQEQYRETAAYPQGSYISVAYDPFFLHSGTKGRRFQIRDVHIIL